MGKDFDLNKTTSKMQVRLKELLLSQIKSTLEDKKLGQAKEMNQVIKGF